MELIIILGVGIVGYAVIAVFYPEWVGITGKVAKKNLENHRGENPPEDN